MRSLTQSPSLGYIPFAFPLAFSQMSDTEDSDPSLSGDTSLSSSGASSVDALAGSQALIGTQVSYPTMYSEHFVPTVPTLPPDHTQPNPADAESQRSSNMLYLSQLLLDATNAHVPQLASSPSGDSEYLSGLLPLSFAPSLQSHSTSVLGTVSTNPAGRRTDYMWYPPPPVAFKARVTDLALLTKRIRATYEENAGDSSVTGR
ncbi:uncharacterized protein B0H18DRAFT_974528 [Fomitopsis serialis]|uniref:uncharacterized protein n=1 Tax=Fomitopsis serialis TaxID=139415 RepID=UPI002007ABB8|nr:uncharacterized protein B0H18DRAFT_974528 [Neoantrodia serialis]KAH9936588.1 hypothetical protein B0H18DRAFT_974528 [Neoantrodia serialis]